MAIVNNFADWQYPNRVEPTESQVVAGVDYGLDGDNRTGTHVSAGSGVDHSDQLDRIEAALNAQTPGKITQVSPVTPGGDIQLTRGVDYRVRRNSAVSLPISDPGGTIHARLTDSDQTASIVCAAGYESQSRVIVGTVDTSDVSYAGNKTTLLIEFTAAALAAAPVRDDYTYHLIGLAPIVNGEDTADVTLRISGCLSLENERATS